MLIKNTNPNELLAEFKRDRNFCPYNEEELERLKKEGERLRKDVTDSIGIWNKEVYFNYSLSKIAHKGVRYEYGEYGSIYRISPERYSKKCTEYVRFEDFGKIVFFYGIKDSDGNSVWSIEATRADGKNLEAWLWIVEELKFKKVGY